MNLVDLLDMGITASLDDDGGLLLDAPKGALSADLIERIRQSKPGLIAEIRGGREVGEVGELHPSMFTPPGKGTPSARDVHHDALSRAWLLHFPDRDPMEVWTAPPATHAEALALNPDAIAAEPIPDHTSTRTASTSERNELLALLEAIYADDTEADRQEAIGLALADPDGALTCYRAIAAERGLSVSKPVSTETAPAHLCRTCRHRATPGRAEPGYCAQREDLPKAYGGGHPLHHLPADGGTACPKWAPYD